MSNQLPNIFQKVCIAKIDGKLTKVNAVFNENSINAIVILHESMFSMPKHKLLDINPVNIAKLRMQVKK